MQQKCTISNKLSYSTQKQYYTTYINGLNNCANLHAVLSKPIMRLHIYIKVIWQLLILIAMNTIYSRMQFPSLIWVYPWQHTMCWSGHILTSSISLLPTYVNISVLQMQITKINELVKYLCPYKGGAAEGY